MSFELQNRNELQKISQATIFRGSKSFSLASLFFEKSLREPVYYLYSWCRYCDDMTDEELGLTKQERLERLSDLRRMTDLAFAGQPENHPVFQGLSYIAVTYKIPSYYAQELLNGMQMDIEGTQYQTLKELELYCYRVAGVVGLMMCHIMGVSNNKALKNACSMGMAMQLTNICRDVREDFLNGRVYLPITLLATHGVSLERVNTPENKTQVLTVVQTLLKRAEEFYQEGLKGIVYLPRRSALAITAARFIYSEIGNEVLRQGPRAWDKRPVVGKLRKLYLAAKSVVYVFKNHNSEFKRTEISSIWRYS